MVETKGDPGFHEDCLPFARSPRIINRETLKAGKMGNDQIAKAGVVDSESESVF